MSSTPSSDPSPAASAGRALPSSEDVLAEVRPRLRPLADLSGDLLRERLGARPAEPQRSAHGVLGGEIAVEVAVPRPRGDLLLSAELIAGWGMTFDAVLERAVANLLRERRVPVTKYDGRVYAVHAGDGHDAARLVVAHRLFAEAGLAGPVVAVAPHRGVVLGASADDPEGLVLLANIAAGHADRADPVSSVPFVRDDAGWLPFVPPAGHPARPGLRALVVATRLREAEEQRILLERLWERDGRAVHAAKLHAVEDRATGERQTVTTWSEGFASALPRADLVAIAVGGAGSAAGASPAPFFVRWDDVLAISRPWLRDLGLHPQRFLVISAPAADQLAALRARALPM